jgi:DNA-directed RNA polymerase subunit H (RpoH/RPB5)
MSGVINNIYNNLFIYLKYRNIKAKTQQLDGASFTKTMHNDGYVNIVGDGIVILLIHPDKKYSKLDMNMKTLVKKYSGCDELLIVSKISYTVEQNITKIKGIISSIPDCKTLINFRSYMTFIYDIPNHILSVGHKIINKEDIKTDFGLVYLSIKELPKIYDHDPQSTWLGAKTGDIIEIERISPVAGATIVYREVISKIYNN